MTEGGGSGGDRSSEQGSEPSPEPAPESAPAPAEPPQSVGTAATRGFLWANLGVFTRYASALVLAAALARLLDPTEYAVMVTLVVVTFYFDNALDMGMGAALVYEQEQGITYRVQVAFTTTIGITAVLATVAFFGAPLIGSYFSLPEYTTIFRLLAIVVVLSGCAAIPWSLFTRSMDFKRRAVVEVVRDLTRFALTLGLAFAGFGAWSVIAGMLAGYFMWATMTWLFLHFRPTLAWNRAVAGELFSYAWRMAGTRFLGVLSLNGDYVIVGNRRPDQYPLYYQAFRLPEFVMGAQLNAMSAVLFPMYARIRAEGRVAMADALYRALRFVALFSIPVGLGLAVVARDAVMLMYGSDSDVTVMTMQVLSLTGCVVGLGFATGDLLFAIGRPGVMVRINLVMVPLMLVSMWFIAGEGIVWVAVTHLVIATVFTFIRQLVVNRIVGASMVRAAGALVPGIIIGACVVVTAVPVRWLTPGGFTSMLAIVAAGSVGGLIGLGLSPSAREQLRELLAKVRG